jgi:hypothetical protein
MFIVSLATIIILIICMVLLCVKVLLKKNGRFPNTHVDSSPALRKKGIACARTQDWQASHRKNLADLMGEMMSN